MASNALLYVLLRLVAWLLPRVPDELAYGVAGMVGQAAYYVMRSARHAILGNLSIVMALPPTHRVVRKAARNAFGNDAKNWVDTLRIRGATEQVLRERVKVDGWENLDHALREGKGAILLGLHLGNFDLVGQILMERGYGLTVPVERMKPEYLFRFVTEGRRSLGMNLVPIDRAPRELPRAIRAGKVVGLFGDRNVAGKAVCVNFFGKPALLPRGAVALARLTGAPILLAYGIRLSGETFHGFVGTPIWVARDADDTEEVSRLVPAMEHAIDSFPDQWLAFQPVWQARHTQESADTIERQKGLVV